MHEGWEWRRVGWPWGRTVTGQGEGGWYPGEQALAQGQREGQPGGWPAQTREHVLGGPRGCLSEINRLVRERELTVVMVVLPVYQLGQWGTVHHGHGCLRWLLVCLCIIIALHYISQPGSAHMMVWLGLETATTSPD